MKFKLPTGVLIGLGVAAAILSYLNQATFGFGPQVKTGVTVGLLLIGALGVTPLIGPAFRAAVHLPAVVVNAIGVVLTVLTLVIQQAAISGPARGVVVGVLTFAAYIGFDPLPVPPVAKARAKAKPPRR